MFITDPSQINLSDSYLFSHKLQFSEGPTGIPVQCSNMRHVSTVRFPELQSETKMHLFFNFFG